MRRNSTAIKATCKPKRARRVAGALSLLGFVFMSAVSAVIFVTEDHLDFVDYLLIAGAPFALSVLAYLVGIYHDPTASD